MRLFGAQTGNPYLQPLPLAWVCLAFTSFKRCCCVLPTVPVVPGVCCVSNDSRHSTPWHTRLRSRVRGVTAKDNPAQAIFRSSCVLPGIGIPRARLGLSSILFSSRYYSASGSCSIAIMFCVSPFLSAPSSAGYVCIPLRTKKKVTVLCELVYLDVAAYSVPVPVRVFRSRLDWPDHAVFLPSSPIGSSVSANFTISTRKHRTKWCTVSYHPAHDL